MNIIKYAMKVVRWTAIILIFCLAKAVAATDLLEEDAPKTVAAKSTVPNVLNTAAEATIPYQRVAENHCAACTIFTTQCLGEGKCLFANAASAKSNGEIAGRRLANSFPNRLLNTGRQMNENNYLGDIDKTVLDGIDIGVFKDKFGERLLELYDHGIRDSFVINNIEERVRKAQRRIAFSGCRFRVAELHYGDYTFGYDIYNREIRTWRQYSNAGTLIIGNTGSGKSNVSQYRALQIIPHADTKGAFLFDIRKKEYRHLRPLFAKVGIDLKIIRGRQLKLNPLEVPYGVEPIEYASLAADFIVKALNLPPRASTLLRSTIIKLYMHYGVLNGSEQYPTLFHLYAAIKADRNANPQAKQAVLDNLESVLLALGPEMLAYHRGWSVQELVKQHLAIELTGLPEAGKDLILAYLLTSEFSSRIARGISNPQMDLYVAFDEGQRLFAQQKESSGHEGDALIDLAGLTRGAGIGLEVSVLSPCGLTSRLPSLTSTRILGRCGSIADYTAAGSFIGIDSGQATWLSHHLVPGMFLGQLSEGDFRYPFLFRVPLLHSASGENEYVSDAEADRSIEGFSKMKLLPASGI
jgi:hypothetical protein